MKRWLTILILRKILEGMITSEHGVDVFVTSECVHPYFLCIVTRCLFWDVFESCHALMFRSGSFYNEKVMSSHYG